MAIVRGEAEIFLTTTDIDYRHPKLVTSEEIVYSDGYNSAHLIGSGLIIEDDVVVSGIIDSFFLRHVGETTLEITDIDLDASTVFVTMRPFMSQFLFSSLLSGDDIIYGNGFTNWISGFDGDDTLYAQPGYTTFWGGNGTDTIVLSNARAEYSASRVNDGLDFKGGLFNSYRLYDVERVQFSDGTLAINEEAAQAYRLYQAAFDRSPDLPGLKFWVEQMDEGATLGVLAEAFVNSEEFALLYPNSNDDGNFVASIYENVLSRAPDEEGHTFWTEHLVAGMSRSDLVIAFSESWENQMQTMYETADGVWLG